MASKQGGPGRKPRGKRKVFRTLLSKADAETVISESRDRSLWRGDYIAACVAIVHGRIDELPTGGVLFNVESASGQLESASAQTVKAGRADEFVTRIPVVDGDVVTAEAVARDLTYSAYIAACVAIVHGHLDELPPRVRPVSEQTQIDVGDSKIGAIA
jgi:hypothetical protein